MLFKEKLNQLLTERDMTQADLSRATDIPSSLISNYVKGSKTPTLSNSVALAKALNISLDELAGIELEPIQTNKHIKAPPDESESAIRNEVKDLVLSLSDEEADEVLDYLLYLLYKRELKQKRDHQ